MARRAHNYTQLGFGECGHVVQTWPLLTDLGGKNPRVFCEECEKSELGLDNAEAYAAMYGIPVEEVDLSQVSVVVYLDTKRSLNWQQDDEPPAPRKKTAKKPEPIEGEVPMF